MEEKKISYLERQLEANFKLNKNGSRSIIFQRANLKMQDPLELSLIQGADSIITREIQVTEDEVVITVTIPEGFSPFEDLSNKTDIEKLVFAYQLIQKIKYHSLERLNPFVCPENILFNQGFTPFFLHYGLKDSIPPYREDGERLFEETRAMAATVIDSQYSFEEYLRFRETLKLSAAAQEILSALTLEDLEAMIRTKIEKVEKEEKSLIHIPKKKWRVQRYLFIAAAIFLIPMFIYTIYSLFFQIPRQEDYVVSGEHFLNQKYSQVVDTLEAYPPEDMPYVVQYELATSYVVHETLSEEQKKNVQNMMTLKTDPQYFLYWIYIGRGLNQEAIDIARTLEDQDLIMFGLIKYREEVKADDQLSGEEKEKELNEIQQELEGYLREQEELEKANLEEKEEKTQPPLSTGEEAAKEPNKLPASSPDAASVVKEEPATQPKQEPANGTVAP
ncbi:MAG TPA: type VII secretion protein EssB [Chondromyces sp.]|nr:type VII secretion protein EssB [Chondromyces sp.]